MSLKITRPTPERISKEKGCLFPMIEDDNLKAWADKHALTIKHIDCPECKTRVYTTIPFYTKKIIGLTTPDCINCGYETRTTIGKITDKKILNMAKGLFHPQEEN